MKVAYVERQGIDHLLRQIECQDAATGKQDKDVSCIVLCDGAGSNPKSNVASHKIVEMLKDSFCDDFERLWSLGDEKLQKEVICKSIGACQGTECERPDCTLLLAVVSVDGRALILHIGDGVIIGVRNGEPLAISTPENGADVSETYFLSSGHAAEHLRVYRYNPIDFDAILMCSDGPAGLLYRRTIEGEEIFGAAVVKFCDWLKEFDEQKVQEAIDEALCDKFSKYTADDLSIAIILAT